MTKINQLFVWSFVFSVLIILILPNVLQDGMFMDGLLYSCVSKNLSHGIGNFWFPSYSPTLYPFFDQQPPLGFGIQSIFYSFFGDSMYVERIYSFSCAIISAIFINSIWKTIFNEEIFVKKTGWYPILLWITIPVCFWAYSNNMLENTMGVFDLTAIFFIIKFLFVKPQYKNILLAGFFIFLAVFTKGVQGAFPIALFFFAWLIYKRFSFLTMLKFSLTLVFIPTVVIILLFQFNDSRESISEYIFHRVVNSIINVTEVQNRFYLIERLFMELLPAITLTVIINLVSRKIFKHNGIKYNFQFKQHFYFFLLIAISASFPLMITLEQRGFYLVTSLPYFAIVFASFSAPNIVYFIQKLDKLKINTKAIMFFSTLLVSLSILYSLMQIGKKNRDAVMLSDIHVIGKTIQQGTTLSSTKELWMDWSLQEYLVRYYSIYLRDTISTNDEYLLLKVGDRISTNSIYTKTKCGLKMYSLYKRRNIN